MSCSIKIAFLASHGKDHRHIVCVCLCLGGPCASRGTIPSYAIISVLRGVGVGSDALVPIAFIIIHRFVHALELELHHGVVVSSQRTYRIRASACIIALWEQVSRDSGHQCKKLLHDALPFWGPTARYCCYGLSTMQANQASCLFVAMLPSS